MIYTSPYVSVYFVQEQNSHLARGKKWSRGIHRGILRGEDSPGSVASVSETVSWLSLSSAVQKRTAPDFSLEARVWKWVMELASVHFESGCDSILQFHVACNRSQKSNLRKNQLKCKVQGSKIHPSKMFFEVLGFRLLKRYSSLVSKDK